MNADDLDAILTELDEVLLRLWTRDGGKPLTSIRLQSYETTALEYLGYLRDILEVYLKFRPRSELLEIFGQDCHRIAHIITVLDHLERCSEPEAHAFRQKHAADVRWSGCRNLSEAVRNVLVQTSEGLKRKLPAALFFEKRHLGEKLGIVVGATGGGGGEEPSAQHLPQDVLDGWLQAEEDGSKVTQAGGIPSDAGTREQGPEEAGSPRRLVAAANTFGLGAAAPLPAGANAIPSTSPTTSTSENALSSLLSLGAGALPSPAESSGTTTSKCTVATAATTPADESGAASIARSYEDGSSKTGSSSDNSESESESDEGWHERLKKSEKFGPRRKMMTEKDEFACFGSTCSSSSARHERGDEHRDHARRSHRASRSSTSSSAATGSSSCRAKDAKQPPATESSLCSYPLPISKRDLALGLSEHCERFCTAAASLQDLFRTTTALGEANAKRRAAARPCSTWRSPEELWHDSSRGVTATEGEPCEPVSCRGRVVLRHAGTNSGAAAGGRAPAGESASELLRQQDEGDRTSSASVTADDITPTAVETYKNDLPGGSGDGAALTRGDLASLFQEPRATEEGGKDQHKQAPRTSEPPKRMDKHREEALLRFALTEAAKRAAHGDPDACSLSSMEDSLEGNTASSSSGFSSVGSGGGCSPGGAQGRRRRRHRPKSQTRGSNVSREPVRTSSSSQSQVAAAEGTSHRPSINSKGSGGVQQQPFVLTPDSTAAEWLCFTLHRVKFNDARILELDLSHIRWSERGAFLPTLFETSLRRNTCLRKLSLRNGALGTLRGITKWFAAWLNADNISSTSTEQIEQEQDHLLAGGFTGEAERADEEQRTQQGPRQITALTVLDLENNHFSADFLVRLAELLQNATEHTVSLRELRLSGNGEMRGNFSVGNNSRVTAAFAALMEENYSLVRLGLDLQNANHRHLIDRALMRNNWGGARVLGHE